MGFRLASNDYYMFIVNLFLSLIMSFSLSFFNRGDKSDVMTVDLVNAEKKVDLMKVSCQSTEKKIATCLKSYGSGNDPEKRCKKMPELHLSQCLLEHGEQLGNDSLLG